MNINKITIIGSIIAILIIISIPTIYKVIKKHNDDLYQVVEEKIIAAAKDCYYDEICIEEKITLEKLYELDYIEKMYNPVTKEYYNILSYVERENLNFKFQEVN